MLFQDKNTFKIKKQTNNFWSKYDKENIIKFSLYKRNLY